MQKNKKQNYAYSCASLNLGLSIFTIIAAVLLIVIIKGTEYFKDVEISTMPLIFNAAFSLILMVLSIMLMKDSKAPIRKYGKKLSMVVFVFDVINAAGLAINVFSGVRASIFFTIMYIIAAVYAIKDYNQKEPVEEALKEYDQQVNQQSVVATQEQKVQEVKPIEKEVEPVQKENNNAQSTKHSTEERLNKLEELYKAKKISESEYNRMKEMILKAQR